MEQLYVIRRIVLGGLFVAWMASSCVHAPETGNNEVRNQEKQAVVIAKRVNADRNKVAGKAEVIHYIVPAMSVVQRLPDAYPLDGQPGGALRIIAAKDEYEPGSFELYSFKNFAKVELKVSPLKSSSGIIFPAENLDLTVIKTWYQNGNGWYSYFADPGLKLIPELLLHDENLIKVDRKKKANFARIDYPSGSEYRWISAPRYMDDNRKNDNQFKYSILPFADATKIRPVSLKAGEFKQFFLTAHVTKNCPAGIYSGQIKLKSGNRIIGTIPVKLRVLDFILPAPKTYFNRNQDFVVALMGGIFPSRFVRRVGGDKKAAEKLFLAVLKNQRRHNILHAKIDKHDPRSIELLRQAGISTNPVMTVPYVQWFGMHWGGRYNYDQLMNGKISARKDADFFMKHLGHTNVIMKYADEPGANFVAMARNLFPEYLNYDFMVGTAGHAQIFNKAGYMWRYIASGAFPEWEEKGKSPECFNKMGVKGYTGFYAGQHNGVENPQFVRRQHGMLSYLKNWSMIDNYEFGFSTWNDRANGLYKPMNLAYPTSNGAVDTLAWEGFREGIDDMRYATELMQLADYGEKSKNLKLKIAARKVKQYLSLLNPEEMDLNELRLEMINKILELKALGAKCVRPVAKKVNMTKVHANTIALNQTNISGMGEEK